TVRLQSIGIEALQNGAVTANPFVAMRLVRDDDPAVSVRVAPPATGTTWIDLTAAAEAAAPAPGEALAWTRQVDVGKQAAVLGASLRQAGTGAPLVRAVEAGSGATVPVHANANESLASNAIRVADSAVTAYNAPNPFHAQREQTVIHYRVDGAADV